MDLAASLILNLEHSQVIELPNERRRTEQSIAGGNCLVSP
jgi:hypothetical protein